MALAVVLVVGAGLLLRTLAKLSDVDPGFSHKNVLAVEVALRVPRELGIAAGPFAVQGDADHRRAPAHRLTPPAPRATVPP